MKIETNLIAKTMSRFHLETIFWWAANMDLDDTKRLSTKTMQRVLERNLDDGTWDMDLVYNALRGGE